MARSLPWRTWPAPARPPISAETASIMIDLPAPVSPVSTLRPGPNSISMRPARAKSWMWRARSTTHPPLTTLPSTSETCGTARWAARVEAGSARRKAPLRSRHRRPPCRPRLRSRRCPAPRPPLGRCPGDVLRKMRWPENATSTTKSRNARCTLPRASGGRLVTGGSGVTVRPVFACHFDEAQLPDVPGDGGLRHVKARPAQLGRQLFLGADRLFADDAQDRPVALFLGGMSPWDLL